MAHDQSPPIRLALFGAAPDTPNMGVSALYHSAIGGLAKHLDNVEFVVFDNGWGKRVEDLQLDRPVRIIRFGARGGRRYHRPENLAAMYAASKLGALGATLNEGIRLIDSCDAVLDVSGGDSFSDIYGRARFDNVWRPKAIAINRGKPLILLPQTYGPYNDPEVRRLAASVVQQSAMAWARDADSYAGLKSLLGDRFDANRHRCGVDMAFGLTPRPAPDKLDDALLRRLSDRSTPLIGFNISGLIYNSADGGAAAFGLKADYRAAVRMFLGKVLEESNAHVVLTPHVMDRPGHYESDLAACMDVAARLGDRYAGRINVAPATLDQSEVKWLISHMDWFCGTRMHATIAALSSGVPTAAISYSDKTKGVFETCGQAAHVFDPRSLDTESIVAELNASLSARESADASLKRDLPRLMRTLANQFDDIARATVRGEQLALCAEP